MPKPENFENTIFYYGYLLEVALIKSGVAEEEITDRVVTDNYVEIEYKDEVSIGMTASLEDAVDVQVICTICADFGDNDISIFCKTPHGQEVPAVVPSLVEDTYNQIIKVIGLE